jgi:molecular chaperone Hsp33
MNELQPFLFEGLNIRGALVRLRETWRSVVAEHHYPRDLEHLIGGGVVATVLIGSALKDQPGVSLQLQGEGRLRLLLVQCSCENDAAAGSRAYRVRAMAQWHEAVDGGPWLHQGRLAVNVDTGGAQGLYQGIVPLVSQDIGQCLESYFRQSEQLPTRLVLKSAAESTASAAGTDAGVAGLLLQVLPGEAPDAGLFDELTALANTVSAAELNELPANVLLQRLFSRHTVRLFAARPVLHDCRCTPEHLAGIVRMLGEAELRELLVDPGWVELNCEFCNRAFRYDEESVDAVLRGESPGTPLH